MKRILIIIMAFLGIASMTYSTNESNHDFRKNDKLEIDWFKSSENYKARSNDPDDGDGIGNEDPAPIDDSIFFLAALGAGYAIVCRKKRKKVVLKQ